MAKQIILKGDPLYKEARAAEADIRPGMLLELDSAGEVVSHINAGQDATPKFAIENRDVGDDIDVLYADDANVHYVVARPGDEINALLVAGTGGDAAIGDEMESDGNGALQVHTPISIVESGSATKSIYTRAIVAVAIEAVNNDPGSGGIAVRLKVEVV